MSIIDYIKLNLSSGFNSVLELDSGDQNEAQKIINEINVRYFAIDKKEEKARDSKISLFNLDFFNVSQVDNVIKDIKFDLIFSNYSLCFNKKDIIVKFLPYYFNKIKPNGIFYLNDFSVDEQTVKKRTNLDDQWFFDLLNRYFKSYTISRQTIYEKEHGHSHSIFELIASK